jgi:hypothetical protein
MLRGTLGLCEDSKLLIEIASLATVVEERCVAPQLIDRLS